MLLAPDTELLKSTRKRVHLSASCSLSVGIEVHVVSFDLASSVTFKFRRSSVQQIQLGFFFLFSQGYTTVQMTCSQEMHNLGYAWRTLKEQLGEHIENHIHRMTFLKGRTVCWHIYKRLLLFRSALKTYCCDMVFTYYSLYIVEPECRLALVSVSFQKMVPSVMN